MSGAKLFDYNSSFSVIRTNPKLTGNFRITVDSSGVVNFNSMSVNPTLSDNRFKAFNITGENSFSLDLFNFFDEGQTPYSTIFQVGEFTKGSREIAKEYSEQYDFYYASGASPLADKNYGESFSYFAPLWIKNEIPDYFVIFKVPGPIAYPYSKNYTAISPGVNYKIIKDYYSEEDFKITYGKDPSGNDIVLVSGDIFTGNSAYNTYTIIGGVGKVVIYNELEYLEESNDINSLFTQKILPNLSIVKTFDIGENTKIGKYIRSIFNDPQFSKSPIDVSFGPNAYTYFNGVSVKDGIYTRKGEILSTYYSGDSSDKMIDFESYVTSGFSRNGIICPNLLNMEFLFNDDDSDMYTINRYMGFYVSRNDMASLRLDGNAFYEYRNMPGNNNLPEPSRNSFGYYYDNTTYGVTASNGVRLFYEGASGYLPGAWDVNAATADSNKIFYLTDKYDNFYNLGRSKDLVLFDPSNNPIPDVSYGPFDPATGGFVIYGSSGATSGNVLLQDTKIDLLNFTGTDQKVGTIPGTRATSAGKAYCEIEFTKNYDLNTPLTLKIYWPNGKKKEGSKRYDIVSADDFSSSLVWVAGSYYSTGSSYYFNAKDGTYEEIATALSNLLDEVNYSTWETGVNLNSTIIRLNDSGIYGNTDYSISVFDDYSSFVSLFRGNWSNTLAYSVNDIVIYNGNYYQTNSNISTPTPGTFNSNPDLSGWNLYMTFSNSGYLKINGTDASAISSAVYFEGGTRSINSRVIFPVEYDGLVEPGYFIKTTVGYSIITSVTKYVDSPNLDPITKKIIGFNDFTYLRVANIEESIVTSTNGLNTPFTPIVELGSDNSFNTYKTPDLKIGVFTFFDSKEFDFDFWSSNYGYTPTAETYKYFQLQPNVANVIEKNIPYIVKQGQINYAGALYDQGSLFYGATGYTSFTDANPNLYKDLIVIPAQYSDIEYNPSISNYTQIGYNGDLDAFNGFIGIQSLTPNSLTDTSSKLQIFNRGKLDTEYEYLQENYTAERANVSRIVPFINKWAYTSGTDSRGNNYRLNVSPAFSPTNFSPSLDKNVPDARYVTHEWFLLEQPPVGFPVDQMQDQNSYLAGKIDLNKARSADPSDYLYLNSYFTVEPSDYQSQYVDNTSYTKELFTPFKYNKSDGYYETLFRGVKVTLKKRSNISDAYSNSADKYIPKYRGYEDYKFAAILRPIAEDDSIIQDPVRYEIIENAQQKFILFVCDVLMRDYKSLPIGYTGGTGGSPILDYTLLYSLSNKEKLRNPLSVGEKYYEIADIKLSSALDLSLSSGSIVNTVISPGIINYIPSSTYDTDLREEIHAFFAENSPGAISGPSPTGTGSFVVPSIFGSPTYPWPIGVGPNYIEFGKVATGGASYIFNISFSVSNPVTVPVGPSSVYRDNPVFQKGGGENYYDSILTRISAADISARINRGSKYIVYKTYIWDDVNSVTIEKSDDFQLRLDRPTRIVKGKGTRVTDFYGGPQTIGQYTPTGYTIQSNQNLPSTLLRYSGGYEPLFRKVIHFDRDKTDKISGYTALDLSFRNCNFAPYKLYFGISRNLQFTKVSPDSNILSLSEKLPEGPVYPLVGQSPIWKKDFNLFSSTWDPGYYQKFTGPSVYTDVAGTRSMKEYKTFFGSKIMQTPDPIDFDNYITLQISRTNGNSDVAALNNSIDSYIKSVQEISPTNSGTGIGSVGPYLSGVDYDKIDPNIFPDAEIIWQYFKETNLIKGTIRLDRMLRRYLLNSGIKQVFIDNMISDFGVGSPDSINDDVNTYIDLNVSPLYMGNIFDLYVNKNGTTEGKSMNPNYMVRGDIASSDRYKMEYTNEINYKLTKNKDLIYNFEYNLESNYNYSLLFDLGITKI
jgi:hypothetical protein